jgi:hypothetical protein
MCLEIFDTCHLTINASFVIVHWIKQLSWDGMHITHHTKVNDDMEFHYYKKILIVKMIGFRNWTSLATKLVKRHGFSKLLIISHICPFWLICSCKSQLQNPKCIVIKVPTFLPLTSTLMQIVQGKIGCFHHLNLLASTIVAFTTWNCYLLLLSPSILLQLSSSGYLSKEWMENKEN